MSIKEVEQAIEKMSAAEFAELIQWIEEFQAELWDRQIAEDSRNGRLDRLVAEAKAEHAAGRTKPL